MSASLSVKLLRSVAFVAIWMALGFAMRGFGLDGNAYLVVGVPLTILWQRFVKKRPFLSLWVRDAEHDPMTRARAIVGALLAIAASVMPVLSLVAATRAHRFAIVGYGIAAIGGACGFGYAATAMRKKDVSSLFGCLVTSGVIGAGLMIALAIVKVVMKHEPPPHALHALTTGLQSFALYVPVCFAMEEVSFRGLIDDDVADPRIERGIFTAIASSIMWGLWHLPVMPAGTPLVNAIPVVSIMHLIVGVPLVLWYRRSGNLLVPATTHAFIDAVRNALVGLPT